MSPIYPQLISMTRDTMIIVALLIAVWRLAFASGKIAEAQRTNAEALKETAKAAVSIADTVKDFVARQQEINERLESMQQIFGARLTRVEGDDGRR